MLRTESHLQYMIHAAGCRLQVNLGTRYVSDSLSWEASSGWGWPVGWGAVLGWAGLGLGLAGLHTRHVRYVRY